MPRSRPHDHENPGDVYPTEPRRIEGMQGSPPERQHHDPKPRQRAPRAIPPAARHPGGRHKQPVRHEHDPFWRRHKHG